jgi:hypothetical protein
MLLFTLHWKSPNQIQGRYWEKPLPLLDCLGNFSQDNVPLLLEHTLSNHWLPFYLKSAHWGPNRIPGTTDPLLIHPLHHIQRNFSDEIRPWQIRTKSMHSKSRRCTPSKRPQKQNVNEIGTQNKTPKTQSGPSMWASLVGYAIRAMTTERGHVCKFLVDKDLAGFRVDASMQV